MIRCSISHGIEGLESINKLSDINIPIQLSLYDYDKYIQYKDKLFEELDKNKSKINVVHLPLNSLKLDFYKIIDMIKVFKENFGCDLFVIHPNKGICNFIKEISKMNIEMLLGDICLCIENFPWRKKKELRSPLQIIDENVKLTLDTSHTEEIWFDHKIMSYLLKNIRVIHLSNRIGRNQHLPFNIYNGDLNLMKFIRELKIYKWQGDIVLEYMPEYSYKLFNNYNYLRGLLGV